MGNEYRHIPFEFSVGEDMSDMPDEVMSSYLLKDRRGRVSAYILRNVLSVIQ